MRIPTNTCWVNMYTHVYPTACAADSDVSQRDLRRVLAALSVPIAPLDLRNVFRAIDTDHSGALSFAKVCTCITHASHMQTTQGPSPVLKCAHASHMHARASHACMPSAHTVRAPLHIPEVPTASCSLPEALLHSRAELRHARTCKCRVHEYMYATEAHDSGNAS